MKKTLIALLALGSVAMATNPDVMNDELALKIMESGYKTGDSFVFSVDFTYIATAGRKTMLTLRNGELYLMSQEAKYVGLATTDGGDPGNWDTYAPTDTIHTTPGGIDVYTNIMSSEGAANGWISFNENKASSAMTLNASSVTLSYDAVAQEAVLTYTLTPSQQKRLVEQVTLSNVTLNATDLKFNTGVTYANFQSDNLVFYKSVPEPTTGTLSLLAVTGLCIRRRKK